MVKGSAKQKAWFEEYFVDFNATGAARRVGYRHPNKIGPRLKQKYAKEISARLREKALSAEESLVKLSEQAMGSIEPFIEFKMEERLNEETGEVEEVYTGEYWIDLAKARDAGVLHLVKEVKQEKKVFHYDSGESETTYRTMVKLHDAQNALKTILEHHQKAGSGPQEHVVMTLDEWQTEAERRRQEAEQTMAMFNESSDEEE